MTYEDRRARVMLAVASLCGLLPACGTGADGPTDIELVRDCEGYMGGVDTHPQAAEAGAIAVDARNVYWSTGLCGGGTALMAVPIKGGHAKTLVSGADALALAIDETSVYWVEKWAVMKAPLAGGPTTHLAAGSFTAATIALDETSVYYSEGGKIFRVPKDGDGSSTTVASVSTEQGHQFPTAIAVNPNGIYWTQSDAIGNGGVFFQSSSDQAATVIAQGEAPIGSSDLRTTGSRPELLVADGAHVYWADLRMDKILGASTDNGSVNEVDEALLPTGIALDDDHVYWTALNRRTHDWDVRRTPRRGGTSALLATAHTEPGTIAVDRTGVYWTNEFGGVAKARLP